MEIERPKNNQEVSQPNELSYVTEVVTENFMSDVIEKSKEKPVIVDFWAPWCEPCKQLTPIIEKLVNEKNGNVILAKMNIDESPEVAQQLKIQSIPAVMAFSDGQPVDGFIGVQPEKNISDFVNKISALNKSSSSEENLEAGRKYIGKNNFEEASIILTEVLKIEPDNISAKSLLARCLLRNNQINEAIEIINNLPNEAEKNQDYISVRSEIEIQKNVIENPIVEGQEEVLKEKLKANPGNHQIRLELAILLTSSGEHETAINELLQIVEADPKWDDGKARKQLIEIFNILGSQNDLVIEGRKKLSSMLFS
tara:strand:+ start:877 stop:1809 length:933 start_codon:yes stop_codon:yes gene_type:complete